MKIVFLNPVGEFGGAERSLLAWMKATKEGLAGFNPRLHIILPSGGLLAERARDLGVELLVLPIPQAVAALGDSGLRAGWRLSAAARLGTAAALAVPSVARYAARLRRALGRIDPDIVHSNGIKSHLMTWLATAGRTKAPPVVWHLHDFVGRRPVVAKVLRRAARSAAVAVAVSEAVAADARAALSGLPVRVVHNVTDTDYFSPGPGDRDILDRLASLPPPGPGTLRVALVATYARWKGQDAFLRAAAVAARAAHAPPMRFYVVGGPIYRTAGSQFSERELRALAAQEGLGSNVGFIPFQDDPVAIYRAADIVVHASTQPEPFGLTVLEAMACERPTIVSCAGGSAELFTPGEQGIGVPPGDSAALGAAIVELSRRADLRSKLGAAARRSAVKRFSSINLPPQVARIYRSIITSRGRQFNPAPSSNASLAVLPQHLSSLERPD